MTISFTNVDSNIQVKNGAWTEEEHNLFLQALEIYSKGQWKQISAVVGTRTPNQTRTHGRKYFEKLQRWERGLFRRNSSVSKLKVQTELAFLKAHQTNTLFTLCEPIPLDSLTHFDSLSHLNQHHILSHHTTSPSLEGETENLDHCVDWLLGNLDEEFPSDIENSTESSLYLPASNPIQSQNEKELKLNWNQLLD